MSDGRACKDIPTRVFFPVGGDSIEPALKACATCPAEAKEACIETGRGQRFGIWGGKLHGQKIVIVRCRQCRGRMLRRQGHHKIEVCNTCRGIVDPVDETELIDQPFVPRVDGVCAHCGDSFVKTNARKMFCSPLCRRRSQYPEKMNVTLTCAECGTEFEAIRTNQINCSTECQQARKNRMRRKVS